MGSQHVFGNSVCCTSHESGMVQSAMKNVALVIFDCDGVLVDSELLSAEVLMQMMSEVGLPITPETFRRDFLGRSFASAAQESEKRFGRPLPDDFQLRYRSRLLAKMRGNLKRMEGLQGVLDSLTIPFCLATGSSPERLQVTMEEADLNHYFQGRAFSASQVKAGKPEPDLFLYAAAQMGHEPADCLVIEDSEMGIRAARAANMGVWHFAGGAHIKAGYHLPDNVKPDKTLHHMHEVERAFAEIGICN
jgi:HAD superfamily hydrolase (TIGR01509 family)